MNEQSKDGVERELQAIAERHGVSPAAARHLLDTLVAGNGLQAQFNHPELGGMGQWSRGGMLMIGDMFNQGLKAKVDALCQDLSGLAPRLSAVRPSSGSGQSQYQGNGDHFSGFRTTGIWWPEELGSPAATGAQNDMRYAFFSSGRRLAVSIDGKITVYGTKDHIISGFSQQQSGRQSVIFTSQHGSIDLSSLEKVATADGSNSENQSPGTDVTTAVSPPEPAAEPASHSATTKTSVSDIFDTIERLAALHDRGILTVQEFEAKKSELLARL